MYVKLVCCTWIAKGFLLVAINAAMLLFHHVVPSSSFSSSSAKADWWNRIWFSKNRRKPPFMYGIQMVLERLWTQLPTAKMKHSISSTQSSFVAVSVGIVVVWKPVGNPVETPSVGVPEGTEEGISLGKWVEWPLGYPDGLLEGEIDGVILCDGP